MRRTVQLAGAEVPRIGLGTNRLTTATENVEFVREAVAAGVRHIDTAHLYTGGDSERAIGAALAGTARTSLVATKGGYRPARAGRRCWRADRAEPARAADRRIDLYYLHRVDPETPLEETLGAIRGPRPRARSATSASPR